MFGRSEIIVGLEIGTAKVCAVVGESDVDGAVQIIGVGTEPTRGAVRKGEIVNMDLAEEAIRAALATAEESADVELRSVHLSVTGSHIEGNKRGFFTWAMLMKCISNQLFTCSRFTIN